MEFRRTGSSDERRRRVLRDDVIAPTGEDEGKKESSSRRDPQKRYSEGAAAAKQPRVTDFLPQRAFTLAVLALLLLTVTAAIEAVYISLGVRGIFARDARFAAFNPGERGNVAAWFASILLATSAAICWVIYRLRMHRIDDFRGRYRVWIMAAAALSWAALDAATGVHHAISAAIEALTGRPLLSTSHGWWLLVYTLVFGGLAVRMLVEIRASRAAVNFTCLAGLCLLLAASLTTGIVPIRDPLEHNVAKSTFFLLGHTSTALAVLSYARHVFLDAQGLLATGIVKKKRKARPKPADEEAAEETDEKESKVAEATEKTKKPAAPAAATSAPAKTPLGGFTKKAAEDDDEDEDRPGLSMQGGDSMSRAERKKQKKIQQSPQRRAA